ncbi:MAG: sulfatase [Methanoregulaceae archaeon]|nr:sulfatase [Methanoregulaceae archaeon]
MILAASLMLTWVAAPPNVVLILVDDLGWQDTSLSFGVNPKVVGRHFRTPNLEALAKRGVQVNQAYSASPVCTPSRVAILTGQNPARNKITTWVHSGQETESPYPGLDLSRWNTKGFQPGDAATLPDAFRSAGYRTIQIGKAHFGAAGTPGANPLNLGFDRSIAGNAAGHPSSYYGLENFAAPRKPGETTAKHNDVPGLEAYHGKDVFLEEALASEASREIEQAAKDRKLFFLWYSPYAVHTPIQPNKKLLKNYRGINDHEAAYATLVESVDRGLGTLVQALKKSGQLENTIIVFTSDNGGLSASARGGYPNLHNLPPRSGKGSAYEGGTRVPLVFAGPGVASGRSFNRLWMTSTDLPATLAGLAGLKFSAVDGRSFSANLQSGEDRDRTGAFVWHFPHYRGGGGPGLEPFSSVRLGDFKAIFFYGARRWELYNLKNDLGETNDVGWRQSAKLRDLAGWMDVSLREMSAQIPLGATTGKPVSLEPPSTGDTNK